MSTEPHRLPHLKVISNKAYSRLTNAKLAERRGKRYLEGFPRSEASPVIRDMRLALAEMIEEMERRR